MELCYSCVCTCEGVCMCVCAGVYYELWGVFVHLCVSLHVFVVDM